MCVQMKYNVSNHSGNARTSQAVERQELFGLVLQRDMSQQAHCTGPMSLGGIAGRRELHFDMLASGA